ncbi:MAG TPA: ribosome small subunit-dependent GTPase A [Clostridiaceae bacterium]|nr:ribosome small subunit-dependent GTPase A [Clostridiaceae bacterium]
MNLTDYGFIPTMVPEGFDGIPARITAVHKERYELVCEFGYAFGRLKASIYYYDGTEEFPTTGDFVMINHNPGGDSQIIKTLERRSFFSRLDPIPGKGEQAVAANFDYVFIMQSLNHDFNVRRMERYVTLAWQSGAVPVIILTKADLADDRSDQIRKAQNVAPGVGVYAISAKTGYGLEALEDYLKPQKTIVFLGSSGVGKSSLVNVLAGQDIMATGDIREDDSRGRHTTTHRQLIMLPNGVMIIDTPGMRELGMWDVSNGLGEAFSDVESFLGQCRFSDCRHQTEPGCAVRAAIDSGELTTDRWESYLKLMREAMFSDDKAGYLRYKQQWGKDIAKWNRQTPHLRYARP